jgi:L-asparaginase II
VPLVEVWRGDGVESVHHGAIAVADAEGNLLAAAGDPETPVYLRSAAKPAQVLPLLRDGAAERFGLDDEAVAVMIGSHGGEPVHCEAVRGILRRIGLGEDALQCGAHAPFHRPTALDLMRRGIEPTALHNNCSGKHAGMLAQAAHRGDDVRAYLDPDHPVQRGIRAVVETLCGLPAGAARPATDGSCTRVWRPRPAPRPASPARSGAPRRRCVGIPY